jgi:hypothetical protein
MDGERRISAMNARAAFLALALVACQPAGAGDGHANPPSLDAQVATLTAELEQSRLLAQTERDEARSQIASLRAELDQAANARIARESEWLRYTKAISNLGERADVPTPEFATDAPAEVAATPPSPPAAAPKDAALEKDAADAAARAAARAERDRAIHLALRSLFTAERILAFELMETGTLRDGATGPVVLRTLDEIGRPTGSICAARMRFEASRTARTLTLVLENGYERRGTTKIPFASVGDDVGATRAEEDRVADEDRVAEEDRVTSDGDEISAPEAGVRRVVLPGIDPAPWIEALPELFGTSTSPAVPDDGHWNLVSLRNELNLLLREDAVGGWWRLASLGGVRGSVICDVVLDQLDRDGHLERKLFADRLTVLREDRGLQLLLESGAQLRGDRKLPFLDGRYRIFLPRADGTAWTSRGVPGLSPPPH